MKPELRRTLLGVGVGVAALPLIVAVGYASGGDGDDDRSLPAVDAPASSDSSGGTSRDGSDATRNSASDSSDSSDSTPDSPAAGRSGGESSGERAAAPVYANPYVDPSDGGLDIEIQTQPPADPGDSSDDAPAEEAPAPPSPDQNDETEEETLEPYCKLSTDVPEWCGDGSQNPGGNPDLGGVAQGDLPIPSPQISVAPSEPSPTLVNLWTWFWIPEHQWQSRSETVKTGQTTVTATIEPVYVKWRTGEGTVKCDGPGEAWTKGTDARKSSCGYEYQHTTVDEPGGDHTVTATIGWHAYWSCSGECEQDGGDLGIISSPASTTELEVRQRQSLVVD